MGVFFHTKKRGLMKSSQHGGARKGAGRKPRATPRKAITVRLEPQDADALREICKRRGVSQAEWVATRIMLDDINPRFDP